MPTPTESRPKKKDRTATSAKLGIATGKNLAEHCRDRLPRWAVYSMWVLMELVAMATDLACELGLGPDWRENRTGCFAN